MTAVLAWNVVTGPLIVGVFVAAGAILATLLIRTPTRSWVLTAVTAIVAGIVTAAIVLWLVNDVFDTFGMPLGSELAVWVCGTFAAVALAGVSVWRVRWWRRIVAIVGLVVFLMAGTLGINAYFGLNPTVGSLFGVSSAPALAVAPRHGASSPSHGSDARPLWQRWNPPAGMPTVGVTGVHVIPNTLSGFHSRPAGLYLPPAALVKDPPALPVMILMMGQPGNPEPSYVQSVLDDFASRHRGLAPIVVIADQLGDPSVDPACSDSARYGKSETFITKDVVHWIKSTFNVATGPRSWTIAGYSNGGACALTYAAKYPKIWGNVVDISGEEYPGQDHPARALAQVFGGDQAAYDDQMPATVFARHRYPDSAGIFTVGSDDPTYVSRVKRSMESARAAGVRSTYYEVPSGGHVLGALMGGLRKGFEVLYPRLGLASANPGRD